MTHLQSRLQTVLADRQTIERQFGADGSESATP